MGTSLCKFYDETGNLQASSEAEDGLAALNEATTTAFDLILMDLQMPKLSGYDVTIAIRKHAKESIKTTPIVTLTTDVLAETRKRVLNSGFNAFVGKPFKSTELFGTMKQFARKK